MKNARPAFTAGGGAFPQEELGRKFSAFRGSEVNLRSILRISPFYQIGLVAELADAPG